MTTKSDWEQLEKAVKRKKLSLALESVGKTLSKVEWEVVCYFTLGFTALFLASFLILQGIHSTDHSHALDEHRKEAQLQACKNAVNVDLCIALVGK